MNDQGCPKPLHERPCSVHVTLSKAVALLCEAMSEIARLEVEIERLDAKIAGIAHLPSSQEPTEEVLTIAEMERRLIEAAAAKYGGVQRAVARELGINQRTVGRKLANYRFTEQGAKSDEGKGSKQQGKTNGTAGK